MIAAEGLVKSFGRVVALRRVTLKVAAGERMAVLGPNGAGKTTLLRILATLSRPTSGSLTVGGLDAVKERDQVRAITGVVAHQTFLYDELTAAENLRFYGRLYGVPALDDRVLEVLDVVGLSHRANERARVLSRGQQQRLAIARAILHQPPLLLLDEPDTGLDADGKATLEAILTTPTSFGSPTVVFTSHNRAWALDIAHRAVTLEAGRLVEAVAA